jgi:hypothetical protein
MLVLLTGCQAVKAPDMSGVSTEQQTSRETTTTTVSEPVSETSRGKNTGEKPEETPKESTEQVADGESSSKTVQVAQKQEVDGRKQVNDGQEKSKEPLINTSKDTQPETGTDTPSDLPVYQELTEKERQTLVDTASVLWSGVEITKADAEVNEYLLENAFKKDLPPIEKVIEKMEQGKEWTVEEEQAAKRYLLEKGTLDQLYTKNRLSERITFKGLEKKIYRKLTKPIKFEWYGIKTLVDVVIKGHISKSKIHEWEKKYKIKAIDKYRTNNFYTYQFFSLSNLEETQKLIRSLKEKPNVDYVGISSLVGKENSISINMPNDLGNRQWQFWQNRQVNDFDFDIEAIEGWNLHIGNRTTIISVIDFGAFLTSHNDVKGKLINPYDFSTNSNSFTACNLDFGNTIATQDRWHGLEVAGMASAATDNSQGVSGTNWNTQIMPSCVSQVNQIASAINRSQRNGADVINTSFRIIDAFGNPIDRADIRNAIQNAHNTGIVLTASAGNNNESNSDPHFPSDYSEVIEVAGIGDNGQPQPGTGYGMGPPGPDVNAPSVNVQTITGPGNNDVTPRQHSFNHPTGTSYAAPQVAGLAGLVLSHHNLTGTNRNSVARRIIRGAVDDVHGDVTSPTTSASQPQLGPDDLGRGKINVFEALAAPRVRKLTAVAPNGTVFEEGDLDGNNVLDGLDWDIDGDSFPNDVGLDGNDGQDDRNDDGDAELDGADDDTDGDLVDNDRDDTRSVFTLPEPGKFRLSVAFNLGSPTSP